jgi:CRISPR system Cascade subunit CasD
MTFSILRFDAPMMSFGAPIVSEEGRIQPYPALSMITGLLANALGFERSEAERHQRLQQAISYAAREDVPGEKVEDYQTADLGLPHMQAKSKKESVAWTTWGHLDQRGSGNTDTTNIRNREYWADAVYTVALYVESLSAEDVEEAFKRPERPLFIGRKPCLPAERLLQMTVDAPSPKEALQLPSTIPTDENGKRVVPTRIWHESDDGKPVTDARDWTNQIHVGERRMKEVDV